MTKLEAKKLFAMLVGALPSAKTNEGTGPIYVQMLEDLEFAAAQRAVARLIVSWEMACLPTIAEIRRAVVELEHGPVRPGGEAWGDVLEAIRNVGGYEPQPEFTDPVVAQVVTAFGWRALCFEGDGVADRARFIQAYDELAKQRRLEQVSGIQLPKRVGPAFAPRRLQDAPEPSKALTPGDGSETAATGQHGGAMGHRAPVALVDLNPIPVERASQWTGRRLTIDELDSELAKTGGGHG